MDSASDSSREGGRGIFSGAVARLADDAGESDAEIADESAAPELQDLGDEAQDVAANRSALNLMLETVSNQFPMEEQSVAVAVHPSLGALFPPAVLSDQQYAIYQRLNDSSYWNNMDFSSYPMSDAPMPPFRSVLIGQIMELSDNRYQLGVKLSSFERDYILSVVLYSYAGTVNIESMYVEN